MCMQATARPVHGAHDPTVIPHLSLPRLTTDASVHARPARLQVDGHLLHATLPTYLPQLVRVVACTSDNLAKVERLLDGWLNSSWYTVEQLGRAKDVLVERRTFLGPADAAAALPAARGATTAALQQLAAQQLQAATQGPPIGRRIVLNKAGQPFGPDTVETRLGQMWGSMARMDSWLQQHLQLPFGLQLDLDGDLGADEELAGAAADPTPCVWKQQYQILAAQDPGAAQELQLMVSTPERMLADLEREQQGLQPGDYVDGGSTAEAQIEEVDFWESDYGEAGAEQEGVQEAAVLQEGGPGEASARSSPHTLVHTAPPAAPQWEMRDDDEDMDLDEYRPGSEELPQYYTGRVSGTSPQEGFAAALTQAVAGTHAAGLQARGAQLGLGLGLGLGGGVQVPGLGHLGHQAAQQVPGLQAQQQVPGLLPRPPLQQPQQLQQQQLQQQQPPWLQQEGQVAHQQPPAWQQHQHQHQQPQQLHQHQQLHQQPQQLQEQHGLAAAPWQQQQVQQQRQQPPGPMPPPLPAAPSLTHQQHMQPAAAPLQQTQSWQHLPPHLRPGNAGTLAPAAAPPPAAGMPLLPGHLPLPPPPAEVFLQQQAQQQLAPLKSSWAQMQEKQQQVQQQSHMQQQQRLSGGLGSMPSYGMAGQVPLQGVASYGMPQAPLPHLPSIFHGGECCCASHCLLGVRCMLQPLLSAGAAAMGGCNKHALSAQLHARPCRPQPMLHASFGCCLAAGSAPATLPCL
jgi:hypothetical protein